MTRPDAEKKPLVMSAAGTFLDDRIAHRERQMQRHLRRNSTRGSAEGCCLASRASQSLIPQKRVASALMYIASQCSGECHYRIQDVG